MNLELRWAVPAEPSTKAPVLQYRTCVVQPHWGPWQDVPTEVLPPVASEALPVKPPEFELSSQSTAQVFTLVCDGGSAPNPGLGGWAYIIAEGALGINDALPANALQSNGAVAHATNNQMELTAALLGLQDPHLPDGATIHLMQDSQYVLKGLTEWMPGWKAKGWKTSSGKPVENQDLWRQLDAARSRFHKVVPQWVRGHQGYPLNEAADALVIAARERFRASADRAC